MRGREDVVLERVGPGRALDDLARVAIGCGDERLEPVRLGPAVVVGEGDQAGAGRPPAGVPLPRRDPAAVGRADETKRAGSCERVVLREPRDRGGVVAVDDDQLPASRGSVCSSSAFKSQRRRSGRACDATTTLTLTRRTLFSSRVRVVAVGNMYPPHHFGGYELVWRAAMEHLRSRGHEVEVVTTDLRTGSLEPDEPGVHRELRWAWQSGGFAQQGLRARVAMARHNHHVLERRLAELRPDVVSWWSMGGLSLTMLEAVRRKGLPAVGFVHDDWLDYGRHVDGWLRLFGGRKAVAAPLAERLAGIPARVDFGATGR